VDVAVRLAALGLVVAWCFMLLRPFVAVLAWGAVLAVALWPLFARLERLFGGRRTPAAAVITVLGLAVIVGPFGLLLANLASNVEELVRAFTRGDLAVPPPPPRVADWPSVGPQLYEFWTQASTNLQDVLARFTPQLQRAGTILLNAARTAGVTLLEFIAAMIVAGVFLANTETITRALNLLARRLTPRRGEGFVALTVATVRNVARGVVGIAFLQGLLLGLGFMAADIPFAGLWALLSIILAIVQIGPTVIVLGTLIYAWTSLEVATAVLFTLWVVPASVVDNVLRPMVMAHGLPVPMLVIFAGVIGGTLLHGLVGLFVGPVILALGYELLQVWIRTAPALPPDTGAR
jgi:predicted PurR-regulated permease PerM